MALSLLCGGLGVAEAAVVHVNEVDGGTSAVYTTDETYTQKEADLKYATKMELTAKGEAIATNTANIATNQGNIKKLEDDKLSKDVAIATYATNKALNDLENAVTNKVDESVVEEALNGKANTDLSNLTEAGKSAIKNTMSADMDSKANKADVYSKTDADGKFATNDALNDLKDTVNGKADKSYVDTEVGKKANKATTLGGYGITDAYTKGEVYKKDEVYNKGEVARKLDKKADQTALDQATGKINDQQTAIDKLNDKTTEISYAAGEGTKISGVRITDGNIVGNGHSAITGLANVQTDQINGKSLAGTTVATATEVEAETLARKEADNKLDKKIDKEIANRITSDTALDKKIDKEIANRITSDTALDKKIDKEIANRITSDTALDKKIDKEIQDRKDAIGTIAENKNYIEKDKSVSDNLVKLDAQAKKNADAIDATNKRTAGIKRDDVRNETTIENNVTVDNLGNVTAEGAVNAGSLNVTGASDLKGNVTLGTPNGTNTVTVNGTADFNEAVNMDNGLTVTNGDTKLKATTVDGKLTAGDAELKNTTVGGTLGVTGETTLKDKLTAKGDAIFEKNVTVQNDLTVDGKLNVGEISMKNDELKNGKKHDSATTITADEISNLAKVTEQGNTTESQFTHNEKGTFNYAKDEKSTGEWKRATSNVTADGVSNKMTDSDKNTHTYYQTATESKEQLVNGDKSKSNFEKKTAEGNTISITEKDAAGNPKSSLTNTQTVAGEKTSVTNNDSSSTIKQGADQIRHNVTSADGKKSSIEVKAEGITNTSKDGTITNDAKDIVNNASGNISNKSQTMDTTVTGKATESYGSLDTTVNGNETHIVKGTKTETVDGKVTENYKAGQETNVTGDQDIKVSGTQTTTATDINRNASSGMIDTIDNDYGTNTETKVAGKTTTDVSIKGTGEEGKYIRGANESRDYLIKGTLKNSETKTAEATSTEITDGNGKTSATIQDVNNLAGSVTNGTETGVSGIHANDNSVSIDSIVTDGNKHSVINQKKGSIQSTVVDGTNSTVILQDKDNVTIASSNGTVAIGGKDIVNNAQNTITNTAGTKITDKVGTNTRVIDSTSITDTAGDSTITTENGKGTTFTKTGSTAYGEGGPTDTNISGNLIQTGRIESNELKVSDKDGDNTADLNVKAGEGVTASASDGNTTGSLDVKANEVGSSVKDAAGNGSDFRQRIDAIMGNVKTAAGESEVTQKGDEITSVVGKGEATNSRVTQKKGSLEAAVTDGTNTNVSYDVADASAKKLTDGTKTNYSQDNLDSSLKTITDGTYTTSKVQTALNITNTAKDGTITNDAKNIVNNATDKITDQVGSNTRVIDQTSITDTVGTASRKIEDGKITDTAGDSTITTENGKGTTFTKTGSMAYREGGPTDTNISGNTITTGKVTMDYADVMKDLGVRGNAKIDGKTTTGSLEVTGTSTLTGNVTMENNATVGNDLTVKGITTTKTLKVTENAEINGNATIKGDVTAKSYKVGDKTYINADGINANNQKITNVADGSISEGSKDAVNGGQLYTVKNDLEGKVNKVGANAAAMANLHPMEFDPDSKWNIAAAIGNYGSETAAALGAFYRPNDDVMVNLSTAFGTGENMVGGGVSVRLGKGGNKLSREESNALKDQVNDLTARMDALLSVLNPNMSKDFPDVPENHWAYEAVSRLAGNDIVQGYPDGEFHGERTMTRYEMAEIIYNALSRGAEAEKELVEEFKPELQAMAASEKATAEKAEG